MSASLDLPDEITNRFNGELVTPADDRYDELRRVQNGLIDRRPQLIAQCRNAADVVDALALGRRQGMEIAVRGGGHNVAGRATGDGLVVDCSLMRGVTVDARRGTIHAGGGARWADLDRTAHLFGLATTGGTVSTTGVAGLTLGGGLGYLMGGYGCAADNLVAAELVTAEGEVLQVTEDVGADVLWGLRGGGGNFGVVTGLTFQGHPLTEVTGGIMAYGIDAAADACSVFRQVCEAAPDELGVVFGLVHAPDGSGAKIAAMPMCHTGTAAQAEGDLKPLRSIREPALDAVGPLPYPVVNTLLDAAFPKGALNYWKSTFLRELNDEAIAVLLAAYAEVPSPMSCIVIEHLHGAVTRVPVDATAFPHREPGFNVLVLGQWLDPAESRANLAWTLATYQALQPWSRGGGYMNYFSADDATRTQAAYGPNLDRLRALKRRLDPENVFHLNQNVLPSD